MPPPLRFESIYASTYYAYFHFIISSSFIHAAASLFSSLFTPLFFYISAISLPDDFALRFLRCHAALFSPIFHFIREQASFFAISLQRHADTITRLPFAFRRFCRLPPCFHAVSLYSFIFSFIDAFR